MIKQFCAALGCLLLLSSCDSGSSGESLSYTGIWNVQYNLTTDECRIVLPTVPGFSDQHQIEQNGDAVTLDAESGFVDKAQASLDDNNGFTVSKDTTGDLFGDGSSCTLTSSFSYSSLNNDTASSIFVQRITCSDGFSCSSEGVGKAVREPEVQIL